MNITTQLKELLTHHAVCAVRNQMAILKASGPGVLKYLQGQITQDINRLSSETAIYAALLTPQGKAVSELHIMQTGTDELLLFTPAEAAEKVVDRLRSFSIGYELRIGRYSPLSLISVQGKKSVEQLYKLGLPEIYNQQLACTSDPERNIFAMAMPEASDHGLWIAVPTEQVDIMLDMIGSIINEDEIEAARIIHGRPRFGCEWNESVFPLNANLIEMGGVSFEKGCYTGQEVTGRMQWRGGIKKKLYRVQLETIPKPLPSSVSSTVEIGTVASAAEDADGAVYGIAHLPIETVEAKTPLIDTNGDSVQVIEACHF